MPDVVLNAGFWTVELEDLVGRVVLGQKDSAAGDDLIPIHH